jgi:hypothetical protein
MPLFRDRRHRPGLIARIQDRRDRSGEAHEHQRDEQRESRFAKLRDRRRGRGLLK